MTYLPPFYKDAAFVLENVSQKAGSVNSLLSQLKTSSNVNIIYAVVSKTLKNIKAIKTVINDTNLLSHVAIDQFLAEALVGDLLFGDGLSRKARFPLIKKILDHEENLKTCLIEFQKRNKTENRRNGRGIIRSEDDESSVMRYVRVNLIKTTMRKVIKKLIKKGFVQVECDGSLNDFFLMAKSLTETQFMIDFHFNDDLLVFSMSSSAQLFQLRLYNEGKIIMQDKASLLAVECMGLSSGMKILDVCCAPGMKTQAIASRLQNDVQIISVDINESRLRDMRTILDQTGVTCSQIRNMDFTALSPADVGAIDVLLLDPSCSGSGMRKRLEYHGDIHEDKGRLLRNASFQTKMLCHAMSFNVKRIVYSTCSLSLLENEQVVKSAFKESPNAFEFKIINALPAWTTRGKGDYQFASKCLRSGVKTLSNGFFVCVLEKD